MIEVLGRFYPMHKITPKDNTWSGAPWVNRLYYSPWTGQVWARIDFGCKEWIGMRLPAERDPAYLNDYVNGSLFTDYDSWILSGLPRDLLFREISLMIDLNSPTLSCYNCPTFEKEPVQMSPSVMEKIAMMRTKVLSNTITDEELREALRLMRADRVTATRAVESKKAAKAPMDSDQAIDAIFG